MTGELFDDFEVNSTPRWPRLSRLVALSVVLHGLLIVAIVYVPTLRAVARAAGSLTGIEFVEEDYTKTVVGERATLVKIAEPYEKLYYPADYFTPGEVPLAPEATVLSEAATVQTAPPPVFMGRQRRGRTRPEPTPEATPEEVADVDAAPTPTPGDAPKTEEEIEKLAADNKTPKLPKINTQPFTDLLKTGKQMVDEKQIDLNGVVEITVEADRNPDGTLADPVITGAASSDPNLYKLAKDFVSALSDSKMLFVLSDIKHLTMKLKLDKDELSVNVVSDVESAGRAREMAIGYGALLAGARVNRKGTDEGELWNGVTLDSVDEMFIMDFKMTREAAAGLVAKQLAKQQQQQQEAPKETPK
ncbi:MAG TPA: hypothetical protein VFX96_09350 [Pyrinomonadaceae bacterium]|nr:hypothetical protein [Pyrinomonadaceae bacterium]